MCSMNGKMVCVCVSLCIAMCVQREEGVLVGERQRESENDVCW